MQGTQNYYIRAPRANFFASCCRDETTHLVAEILRATFPYPPPDLSAFAVTTWNEPVSRMRVFHRQQMGGAEKEAEIHMVHQKEGGDYLVVAVLFEVMMYGHNEEVNKRDTPSRGGGVHMRAFNNGVIWLCSPEIIFTLAHPYCIMSGKSMRIFIDKAEFVCTRREVSVRDFIRRGWSFEAALNDLLVVSGSPLANFQVQPRVPYFSPPVYAMSVVRCDENNPLVQPEGLFRHKAGRGSGPLLFRQRLIRPSCLFHTLRFLDCIFSRSLL